MWKPRKIVSEYQSDIDGVILDRWPTLIFGRRPMGWVTDTRCGRAHYAFRRFSVPLWAYNRGEEYFTYYTCHEMAHIADIKMSSHGAPFMECFKLICPKYLWHHELQYKPRNASQAGIRQESE